MVHAQRVFTADQSQPGAQPFRLRRPCRVVRQQFGMRHDRHTLAQVAFERDESVVPEFRHHRIQGPLGAAIVQQHVGGGAALFVGGLRGDAGAGVGLVDAAVLDEAADAFVLGDVHHEHEIESRAGAVLDQQWNVVDEHRVSGGGLDQFGRPLADERMGDRVQRLAFRVGSESLGGQAGRLRLPSAARMSAPNASTSAARPGVPGSTTRRAIASASTT